MKIRVAHLILGRCNPDSANGVDKTVYNLARHQAALGAEVSIFSLTEKEPLTIPGAQVRVLPPPSTKLKALWPGASKSLIRNILEWKPDVVHFHSVHIGPFIGLGKVLRHKGIPYVVTPNGAFAPGRLATVGIDVRAYVRLLEKSYLEGAKFVHAVSQNDVEGLRILGVKARVVVVPNGLDIDGVPLNIDASLLRCRFPNLKGKRIFLFLGRLDPVHKGLDNLLEAFAAVRLPETALVLVGPDFRGSLKRLQEQVQRLNLVEQVVFAGPVYGKEKWSYLAGADVFVHPSRWEGSSFSVLEALAMSKPVLACRAADPGGIKEYRAGLVVEPRVSDLCEGLRVLGGCSSEELKEMGRRGLTLLKERFNWQRIAERLMEAYKRGNYE